MIETYALFGSGTTGRIIARDFNAKHIPFVFVDSDPAKQHTLMEGVNVFAPLDAKEKYPNATWLASTIIPTFHKEITEEIERLGVKTIPVWGFLPERTTPPPHNVALELLAMVAHDKESYDELRDQIDLRLNPSTHSQRPPSDIRDIYFPEFIIRREDEHFVDAGAADGDTVREFLKHWSKWRYITAFEPDLRNFEKAERYVGDSIKLVNAALSDHNGVADFVETGDYSAHISVNKELRISSRTVVLPLDSWNFDPPPTYIKMDIEGSEPAALWGARRILKEHKPVLAICAYHESSHFWEIPLLLYALQPEYRLYFRRYAQGSFEIVWYAVPPERIK